MVCKRLSINLDGRKFFVFFKKKKKDSTPWTYVIEDVNIEKLLQLFMNKNEKKTSIRV